jgi:phospholipase C
MKHRVILGCLTTGLAMAAAGAVADDDHHHVFTATPIKHLVVIFQENVSFDHYFGTYPTAQNNPGETPFYASPRTPQSINTLLTPLDVNNNFVPLTGIDLINKNPNGPLGSGAAINGTDASNPFRLTPAQALTSDQGHNDLPEQLADDNGKMDAFPHYTGVSGPPPTGIGKSLVMGYYDGNTVTGMWNYAQHFALNDNMWTTTFGPSTPGALNLIAGQSSGFDAFTNVVDGSGNLLHKTHEAKDGNGNYTEIGDGDPLLDACSNTGIDNITMHGPNIGDLLNAQGITWGSFMGGFDLTVTNRDGSTGCQRSSKTKAPGSVVVTSADYIPHHAWFQYFASTRNTSHARPGSVAAIGHTRDPNTGAVDPANHQYDIHDFFDALNAGTFPAVSFLKAPAYQDGHPGYSDPLDEQNFVVNVINTLEKSPEWESTAVVILYDDSDGWYDHQLPPIVNPSFSATADALNGPGVCQVGLQQGHPVPTTPLNGALGYPAQGRCGYGTRIPLLVVSPFAKVNYVDHTLIDQSSVLRFIEDNWLAGQRIQPGGSFDTIAGPLNNMFDFDHHGEGGRARRLFLDPTTGAVVDRN